ncbi:hypothetical protein DPMN_176568 [Dreissena polymorpha]|uniref:Uncharacterized protein n=1 Tax=Dreissena polymorpha TaxID=45954 RepID=A0A9D4EB89_DREPO|nr:hypothetical protein DPMN_176568 [Dreissena polymorpha]
MYVRRSFDEPSVHSKQVSVLESVVTFSVVDCSSQRGKRKLVSSNGFTYVYKGFNPSKQAIMLRCSVRNKSSTCPACKADSLSSRTKVITPTRLNRV